PITDTEFRRRCRGVGRMDPKQVQELVTAACGEGKAPHRDRCFEALAAEEQRAAEVAAKVHG
ncbi:MAG TPA: hypothetical protein VFU72_07965, partial [Nitrolancea sp.]|nr:hypothetical protein [Nitrolancea sp.]